MIRAKWRAGGWSVVVALAIATPGLAQDETLWIRSEILDADRPVHVRFPARYESSAESYPVLYLTDGEAVDRRVMPIVDSLVASGAIPEIIVVGIPHQGQRRTDLTPTEIASRPGSGGGEPFFRFVTEELIPHIEGRYRTSETRVLFGHSLGGLLSAYALVRDRRSFDGFIASSPVIAWDDWHVRERAAGAFEDPADWDVFLFLSAGSEEPERFLERGREFAAWLEDNAPADLRWSFRVYDGKEHMSVLPGAFADGLSEFFAPAD